MDTLQNYLNNPQVQARMYQQQPQQQAYNPITAGSLAGMESARRSLDMDAQERQRAMGLAIARFGAGLSQPGHGPGFAGALSAVNSNIYPAMQSYIGEEDKVAGLKAHLLRQQMELERHKRQEDYKRERDKVEDRFMQEKIGILKDKTYRQEKLEERRQGLVEKGEMPEDGMFYAEQTPAQIQQNTKDMMERRKEVIFAKDAVKTINRMEDIMGAPENKHLWNSYALVLDAADQKNKSLLNQTLRGMNKKDTDTLTKLYKYQTRLGLQELKGMGGRPSDITKKAVFAATPSGEMSPEAGLPILKDMKNHFRETVDLEEKKMKNAAKYRFYYPRPLGAEGIEEGKTREPVAQAGEVNAGNDIDSRLQEIEQEIMSLQGGG
jgi:hypothetical protein